MSAIRVLHDTAPVPGTNAILQKEGKCYQYNVHGHFRSVCLQMAQVQVLQVSLSESRGTGDIKPAILE